MSTKSQPHGYIPLPDWLIGYHKDWLRPDVIAGLTTAAVVIPKAMAYATIAGLPVQVGLYTAFLPMVIYAVLGTSRVLSVSTTTTLAILAAAELGEVVPGGDPSALLRASAMLTLLVGAMLVVALSAAPGLHRQLYFTASADRVQSWDRGCHCTGSSSKNPRHPLSQRFLSPQPLCSRSRHT